MLNQKKTLYDYFILLDKINIPINLHIIEQVANLFFEIYYNLAASLSFISP